MGIKTQDLKKSFGEPPTNVLKGISLEIDDGEFVSLVGKSGCGKSTLLYILSTLDQQSSGELFLDGKNTFEFSEQEIHQFRNKHMGFVFQFHHLLPELNALENVLMPAKKAKTEMERLEFAKTLMKDFGLENKLESLPSQLSGGEQQRVAIARALVMEPKYLFADEPTGNLDSQNGNAVMNLLKSINRERKMTIIMVTHDADFASRANRQISMLDGRLLPSI
jgi:lipoprotein-releasing system ATP-binding protein